MNFLYFWQLGFTCGLQTGILILYFGAVKAMVRRGLSPNIKRICERRSTSTPINLLSRLAMLTSMIFLLRLAAKALVVSILPIPGGP
jgi:hypothetical protein